MENTKKKLTKAEVLKLLKKASIANSKLDLAQILHQTFPKKLELRTTKVVVDKYKNFPIILYYYGKYSLIPKNISIQMEIEQIKYKTTSFEEIGNYDLLIHNTKTISKKCKDVVDNFNNTLRPNESPRKFIRLCLFNLENNKYLGKLTNL